jgi:hypothetical protein
MGYITVRMDLCLKIFSCLTNVAFAADRPLLALYGFLLEYRLFSSKWGRSSQEGGFTFQAHRLMKLPFT